MKKISIVTPCFNEEDNIEKLVRQVRGVFKTKLTNYNYEHIIIDNNSTDESQKILFSLTKEFKELKVIINTRNFGHILSPHHARLQANGDAIVNLACDFQDPPELIFDFVKAWEKGNKLVLGIKEKQSNEKFIIKSIRNLFYRFIKKISEVEMYDNFSSYCLIDKCIIEDIKKINDKYPYFRGLLSNLGYKAFKIYYRKNVRVKGKTKNNFYSLYDLAILGITNYSKIPLRICIFFGFFLTIISFFIGIFYLIFKIIYWDQMVTGIAPLIIILSFLLSFLLLFMGIIGEYILLIVTKINTTPVIEKERINFD